MCDKNTDLCNKFSFERYLNEPKEYSEKLSEIQSKLNLMNNQNDHPEKEKIVI